jgi:alanine racemase
MAVIKANAYGHGMLDVAHCLPDVDAFAVARVPEALHLRENGVDTPIVLLAGFIDREELQAAIEQGFEPVVHCMEQVELLRSCTTGAISIWLKFDTGMNRLGFKPSLAAELLAELQAMQSVSKIRLMTHLSSADDIGDEATSRQIREFREIASEFDGAISIGNSAATMAWPDIIGGAAEESSREHWIRPGIALFVQFEARLIAVKTLFKGDYVGYKRTYQSPADTLLGIISAGYGDGYTRHFRSGTPVLLNGRRVQVIGNVSMDMIAVDLGVDATDIVGDIATLWGDGLPVEEVAPWANAIPYELVCGVMHREVSEVIE